MITRHQRYYRSHREQTKERVRRWLKTESPEHRELRLKRRRESERKRRAILALNRKPKVKLSEEERRERIAESKLKWRMKHQPNFGVGRGHGHHKGDLSHMSTDEKRAHRAAKLKEWRERNNDHVKSLRRAYYQKQKAKRAEYRELHPKTPRVLLTTEERREHRRLYRLLYREKNYQKCLSREREAHRKYRTRKGEYRPKLSRRIPDYATCPAHARWLRRVAETRLANATVSFATAIQSGLTVGRYAM